MARESVFLMQVSPKDFTIGIEEEYMICDPKTGDLVDKASLIMEYFKQTIPDRFSYELIEAEIESNTSVHYEIRNAISELSNLRTSLKSFGKDNNFSLGISGTHPTAKPENQTFIKNESYNWVSNQLGYYARRNITFSTHMHITIPEFDCSINVMNGIRRWIAPLLALSVNSPFFDGQQTKMRSSRTMQFGAFPRTNIPNYYKDLVDYRNYNQKLIESNSILKNRHVWWKLRPHLDYKTLEFRVCDAQRSLENVRILSSLCRALAFKSFIEYKKGSLFEKLSVDFLNDCLWKASRFGFDSLIYDEVSNRVLTIKESIVLMYEYCYDALVIFGDEDIKKGLESILENGTECDDQINVFNNHGFDGLKLYLIDNVEY